MSDDTDNVSLDTYRFYLDKRVYRVRYSDETEDSVTVIIEPRNDDSKESQQCDQ